MAGRCRSLPLSSGCCWSAYVLGANAGTVIPISIATNTVLPPIKTAKDPEEIDFIP
jgi:hypothetical protein